MNTDAVGITIYNPSNSNEMQNHLIDADEDWTVFDVQITDIRDEIRMNRFCFVIY